ncbi:MAG: NAD-dependent epimerase/dehydratase family protein [Candidatus Dormibacteria bacterium]
MRVLVTGGAGFIGSHLCDRLLREGHQVAVVDDLSSGRRQRLGPEVAFHRLDIRSPWLGRVVEAERPEVIYHLAAQIDVRASVRDPLLDGEVNVLGTVRLLRAAVAASVRRVVFVSTGGAIYGDTQLVPTEESHPLRPASPYGAAKAAAEAYLSAFRESFGLEGAVLRPANVYGPRQAPDGEAGVVAIFLKRLLQGQALLINGDGRQTRDFVFVLDLVDALLRLLDGTGGTFNAGTGRETTVLELAAELVRAIKSLRPDLDLPPPGHGPARAGEQQRSCLDTSLARTQLGWQAETDLARGLKETAIWFMGRRERKG